MSTNVVFFAIALISLAGSCHNPAPVTAKVVSSLTCLSPLEAGAIPNDDLDDREAIQAAIDRCPRQEVVLPPGIYYLDLDGTYFKRTGLTLNAGTSLTGPGARLVMRGAVGGSNVLQGVTMGSGTRLHHISVGTTTADTGPSLLTQTTEHCRVIWAPPGVDTAQVDHVSIDSPAPALPDKSGDCIQAVGYGPSQLITNLRIDHVIFNRCARCGATFHSGISHAKVDHNLFNAIRTVAFNEEGSVNDISDVEIDHNEFRMNGGLAIELVQSSKHQVHDNIINGGWYIWGVTELVTYDNVTTQNSIGWNAVTITSTSANITMTNERITSLMSPAIAIVPRGTDVPTNVQIRDSHVTGLVLPAVHPMLTFDDTMTH